MTSEGRHQRLEALFHDCLDVPNAERESWLRSRCEGDEELFREVFDLLGRDARSDEPTAPFFAPGEDAPPERIGPYRLIRRLGEGGFGTVWEAEQSTPVRRNVAVKILKTGMDSKGVLARFEAERQALALMDHPGIAHVFDAGETASGRPYFVMELVNGVPITEDCDRRSIDARLSLFIDVCRAVEHAHQKGVIHRDLKPSNILVVVEGERSRPKVIDFGIAKATAPHLLGATLLTRTGEFLGTPEYMSPEQALSGGIDVDTRSDVYSLGVLLYRLLTGVLPFSSERLRERGPVEMLRVIQEEEPVRPSEATAAVPRPGEATNPARGNAARLRGDLDWIVMKAMEKDRAQRYASPAALADDLERHLQNEPVAAGPPSTTYRLRKLVRRHRPLVFGGIAVTVALALGIVATTVQAWRATRAKDDARRQAEIATATNDFLTRMLAAADPKRNPRGRETTVLEIVDRAAEGLTQGSTLNPETEASIRGTLGVAYMNLGRAERAEQQFRQAFARLEPTVGPHAESTIRAKLLWAESAVVRDRFREADSILATITPTLDAEARFPPQMRGTHAHLRGQVANNAGRFREADSLFSHAAEIRRALPATQTLELTSTLQELSSLCRNRNELDRALALAREALEAARRAEPGDTYPVAMSLGHVAVVQSRRARFAEAESLYLEALRIKRKILGPDHSDLAGSLTNLGVVLGDQGRHADAEHHHREALGILIRAFGDVHATVLTAQNNLATALQMQGRLDEALALRRAHLESVRRAHTDDQATLALSLNNLGSVCRLVRRFPEAMASFREARTLYARAYGENHPQVAIATNNIGKTHLDAKQFASAEPELRHAVALLRAAYPEGHPNTAVAQANHGRALAGLARHAEAEQELLAAHERLTAALGADHARVRETAEALADLYRSWGRPADRARWEKAMRPQGS